MPEWKVSQNFVDYLKAEELMLGRVNEIICHEQSDLVWMLEHNSIYTCGTSSRKSDLLTPSDIPVYQTNRGGQITYHGPGQRVIYLMFDLRNREKDIRKLIWSIEEWIISVLNCFNIKGYRIKGLVGIWVEDKKNQNADGSFDHKIASIGLRIKRWVTYHGLSLNIHPDLGHFKNIVPCGIKDKGVTSLKKLGVGTGFQEIDALFKEKYNEYFSSTEKW